MKNVSWFAFVERVGDLRDRCRIGDRSALADRRKRHRRDWPRHDGRRRLTRRQLIGDGRAEPPPGDRVGLLGTDVIRTDERLEVGHRVDERRELGSRVDLLLSETGGRFVHAERIRALRVRGVVRVDRHDGVGHVGDGWLPVVDRLGEDPGVLRGGEHRLHPGSVELAHEEVRDDGTGIDHHLRSGRDHAAVAVDAHRGQVGEDRLHRHEATGRLYPDDERRRVRRVRDRRATSRRDGLLSARGQRQHRDQDPQALHAPFDASGEVTVPILSRRVARRGSAREVPVSVVGRTYLERGSGSSSSRNGAPVRRRLRIRSIHGKGRSRNVLIRRATGDLVVRPFRGLRMP